MESWKKLRSSMRWLPAYGWQRLVRRKPRGNPLHVILAVADHFEPSIEPENPKKYANRDVQEQRLERWCKEYPKTAEAWRDSDGWPLRHTYFYPAEQYDKGLIERLAAHCQAGWGEVEIQLHHGVDVPDTAENTRRVLLNYRDTLSAHGCLSRPGDTGPPCYAFVHGNWALANSAGGRFCGVDDEMEILAQTGCYADLTLPSAPDPAQVGKINALYECALPPSQRAAHRKGRDLRCGHPPRSLPVMIQGPLMLNCSRRKYGRWIVSLENGALTAANPPTMERLAEWCQAGITVHGRPDWVFIKLHCHGMDPRDEPAMFGVMRQHFLRKLTETTRATDSLRVHFVTAREMMNIILAACDARVGNPGAYRDYKLQLIKPVACP